LTKQKIPPSLPLIKGGAFSFLTKINAKAKKAPLFGKEGLGEILTTNYAKLQRQPNQRKSLFYKEGLKEI